MAKKKDTTSLIWNGAIVLFGLLMFLPMFLSLVNATGTILGQSTTSGTPLFDLINNYGGEAVKAISTTAMIFSCIAIFGGLLLAVVALLNMIGIKMPSLVTKILGAVVFLSTIIAFIMLIVLVNKAGELAIGNLASAKSSLAVGSYLLLIFGLIQGLCAFARK